MSLNKRAKSGIEPGFGRIFASITLALALVFSACGGGPSEVSRDQSDNLTSADEVLAAAREAASSVTSYQSETYLAADSSDEQDNHPLTMTLVWSAPDSFHLRFEDSFEEDGQEAEYISIDGRVLWFKDSMRGNVWTEYKIDADLEDREARGIVSLAARFAAALDVPAMNEAELVGKTVIDGLSVYHVKGASSFRTEPPVDWPADAAVDFPRQQQDTTFDLYIRSDNFLPRRLVTVLDITWETSPGEESEIGPVKVETTVDYRDFNAPVTIELPEGR